MEKDFTKIDKKFIDRAWEDMLSQLDEAMPVPPKKKKRFGFWWLFLGLLAGLSLGAIGTYHFLQEEEQPLEKEILIADVESENLEGKASIAESEIPENSLAKNSDENRIAKTKLEKENIEPSVQKNIAKQSELSASKIKNSNFEISEINPNDFNLNLVKKAIEIAENEETIIEKDFDGIEENLIVNNLEERIRQDYDLLKINALSEIQSIGSEEHLKIALADISDSKAQKWGIQAGGIFSNSWSGWYVDGLFEEEINDRWSWRFGIGYSQQKLAQAINPQPASALAIDPERNFDEHYFDDGESIVLIDELVATPTNIENKSVTIVPLDLKLEYLNISLSGIYKVTPKWDVTGGLIFSTLLIAPSNLTDGGLLNSQQFDSGFFLENAVAAAEQTEINLLQLRKFDVAGMAGLSFKATQNLKINAAYHYGTVNFMKHTSVKNHNRFFKLGLQYQFGR